MQSTAVGKMIGLLSFGDGKKKEKMKNLKELYAAQWLPRLQLAPLLQTDLHK